VPSFLQLDRFDGAALADEARAGLLLRPRAAVPPKFFYDALGSRLFEAITELDEYTPTRDEAAILTAHGPEIAAAVRARLGHGATLIDLGAGNCAKAARLFPLLDPARYIALDIAADFLRSALERLQHEHPTRELVAVGLDFSTRLVLPEGLVQRPALVFYPGSSIGNFEPEAALRLLGEARQLSQGGALLIGVDLVKPAAELEAAYDDRLGVTAAFNLNLLEHLNRLLGADFDVRGWRHHALWNAADSRIEMHLEARRDCTVHWRGGGERRFAAGERIHTENACKWTTDGFAALLRDAGWHAPRAWTDPDARFAMFLAQA
jgi:dimethylhistidine N-methyltransferase